MSDSLADMGDYRRDVAQQERIDMLYRLFVLFFFATVSFFLYSFIPQHISDEGLRLDLARFFFISFVAGYISTASILLLDMLISFVGLAKKFAQKHIWIVALALALFVIIIVSILVALFLGLDLALTGAVAIIFTVLGTVLVAILQKVYKKYLESHVKKYLEGYLKSND